MINGLNYELSIVLLGISMFDILLCTKYLNMCTPFQLILKLKPSLLINSYFMHLINMILYIHIY